MSLLSVILITAALAGGLFVVGLVVAVALALLSRDPGRWIEEPEAWDPQGDLRDGGAA